MINCVMMNHVILDPILDPILEPLLVQSSSVQIFCRSDLWSKISHALVVQLETLFAEFFCSQKVRVRVR